MATAIQNILYKSYSDRGAFVQSGHFQTTDVDESEIIVGKQLPKWPGYDKPIVKEFVPGEHLALRYHDEDLLILKGEEVQLDSSLFSQEYGVCCYILECVKMI